MSVVQSIFKSLITQNAEVRDELEVEVEQLRLAASGEDSEEARVLLENVARLEEMVWILSGQGRRRRR